MINNLIGDILIKTFQFEYQQYPFYKDEGFNKFFRFTYSCLNVNNIEPFFHQFGNRHYYCYFLNRNNKHIFKLR